MLKPAVAVLSRLFFSVLVMFCVTCAPANSTTTVPIYAGSSSEAPDPPPQCVVSYYFVDEMGNDAFVCLYSDSSDLSWNGYGASVYHPYRDGFIVGLQMDLVLLCSGDYPVCATSPSTRCVTPPEFWGAEDYDYALCRTNDGDDLLEVFANGFGGWTALSTWDITTVCVN
ncbi:MAG: hypothetical protein AAB663_02425 [Patescibacteria group bacterium]